MKETVASKVVGTLSREGPLYDYWASDPYPIPFFDQAAVRVVFDYDPTRDGSFIEDADAALNSFLRLTIADRNAFSAPVFKMCADYIELTDLRATIELFRGVEEPQDWQLRVLEKEGPLLEIDSPQQIWRFVRPQEIHLLRADNGQSVNMYVQLLCKCDWDDEDGIQIVFKNGTALAKISGQDGDPI